eukprot:4193538-Amphidinium_carterae.1
MQYDNPCALLPCLPLRCALVWAEQLPNAVLHCSLTGNICLLPCAKALLFAEVRRGSSLDFHRCWPFRHGIASSASVAES